MARKLWSYSNRVGKPFLKLNCAALPSELIESELFGYEKGAFTGALVDKPGKFELAQDGTILLDEIGDMDTRLQAKLLQVLQDGEIQPLGSSRIINVNVRIMAATHRDLQAAIAQGTFREDLYYRLSVINITIPPLRERRDEIIPLAEKLLFRHVGHGLTAPAIPENLRRAMLAHPWPGNVRELENVMRRFLVYEDASLLTAELTDALNLPKIRLAVARGPGSARPAMGSGRVSFDHFAESSRTAESKLLLETLESVRWNRRQAALQLNIDYKALLYKLQKHGIVESKAKRREVSA
jgi:transcriptional regulator with PAS, ATPase and Fis domain